MALRLCAPFLQSLHQPKAAGVTAGGNSTGDRNGEAWSPEFVMASATLPPTRKAISAGQMSVDTTDWVKKQI